MINRIWLISIAIVFGACQSPNSKSDTQLKVIGGEQAKESQFPSAIHVPNCSATKIASNKILTAAHCVSDQSYGLKSGFETGGVFRMRYGIQLKDAIITSLKVLSTKVHPTYLNDESALGYDRRVDLAIITVDGIPAAIPNAAISKHTVEVGQEVFFTGYGCEVLPRHMDPRNSFGEVVASGDVSPEEDYSEYRLKFKKIAISEVLEQIVKIRNPIFNAENINDIRAEDQFSGCPGDSGSAGYIQIGQEKHVIGVNSFISIFDSSLMRVDESAGAKVYEWIQKNLSE